MDPTDRVIDPVTHRRRMLQRLTIPTGTLDGGRMVSSGTYLVQMKSDYSTEVRKMSLVR